MTTRIAQIKSNSSYETVSRYLYANYSAICSGADVYIVGHDFAGFTLDALIDRLASGLHTAVEITNDVEAADRVFAVRQGEDVFAVVDETTGELLDEVVTTEQCDGCGSHKPLVLNAENGWYECPDCLFQFTIFITIAERAVFQ